MNILVLNCGSSSVKYQLVDMNPEYNVLAVGLVERIGLKDGCLTHKPTGKDKFKIERSIPDHTVAINLILDALTDDDHGVIYRLTDIKAVGHRVAHGGENFKESVLVDDYVKQSIEDLFDLAPLHNPANLKGILSMENILPGVPQVAVFDTSFHQSMTNLAYLYAIPYEYYEKYKIRRYGFHGTSHKYVAQKACELQGLDFNNTKIISCHLGNGASITAIENGKSVDTSMGFTPVDGLIMGTRAGSIDPGVLMFLAEKEHLNFKGITDLINKKSGVLGISGLSSDMRDIEDAAFNDHNERAQLALDMYYFRIRKFAGAYAAVMNGVDMILFTGGIGENDPILRQTVSEGLSYLGIDFLREENDGVRGQDKLLTSKDSKVKVMTVTTNEEFVIAKDTEKIISNL